jgi:DNA-binding winged helix-turn-helix (wHTH) protein
MDFCAIEKITIGEIFVYPSHNKLCLGEKEHRLEPKIMQVLCLLIQHRGQVLSRAQIAQSLWPGIVTGPEVVTRAIFELRKILGDDARTPNYIETISRKGYCFIADFLLDDSCSQSVGEASASKGIWPVMLVSSLLLGLLLWGFWPDSPMPLPYQKSQLTHGSERLSQATVNQLVLLDVKSQMQSPVTQADASYLSPLWSPDGRQLFYARCLASKCQIIQQDIQTRETSILQELEGRIQSMALTQDATELASLVRHDEESHLSLLSLGQDKRESRQISLTSAFAGQLTYGREQNSLFFAIHNSGAQAYVQRFDIASQNLETLPLAFNAIFSLTAGSAGELVISGRNSQGTGIWRLRLLDMQLTLLMMAEPGEMPLDVSFNPADARLLYISHARDRDIGMLGALDLSLAGLNTQANDLNAIYSAANQAIYYVSNKSGHNELWQFKDGQSAKLTRMQASSLGQPMLSPQEEALAFISNHGGQSWLNILDVATQELRQRTELQRPYFLLGWQQQSLYMSGMEQGEYHLYQYQLGSDDLRRIRLNAGSLFHQGQAGETYFYDMAAGKLVVRHADGTTLPLPILGKMQGAPLPHQITLLGEQLYYLAEGAGGGVLRALSLQTGADEEVFSLPEGAFVTQIGLRQQPFVLYDRQVREMTWLVLAEAW